MSSSQDLAIICSQWLQQFASALSGIDASAVAALFLTDGWLRDVLSFQWNTRTLHGRVKIAAFLADKLAATAVSNVRLEDDPHYAPKSSSGLFNDLNAIEFGFLYQTAVASGRGYTALVQDSDGQWKAFYTSMILLDLKNHEELKAPLLRASEGPGKIWGDVYGHYRTMTETDPTVIIVGGGQCGLNLVSRLKQMGIPSLLIERNARIGDNWRRRYNSLRLHTIKDHHTFLYQAFPENWPVYTPRDKLADWMEFYATSQDLVIWTSSTVVGRPLYDESTKRWTVFVDHNGTPVELHPAHIVWATGTLGRPRIPAFPGREQFAGTVFHSVQYRDPQPFIGKRAIVVGAGNTAIDIARDLALAGAQSVTMVQRSSTCVVSIGSVKAYQERLWPEGVPLEVSDFKAACVPTAYFKAGMVARQDMQWEQERELHAKLRKGGVKLDLGPEGQGMILLALEKFGGYWQDKGGADLIASGEIKIKQGLEIVRYSTNGLVFSDGSEEPADIVILATGYHYMRDSLGEIFGEKVMQNVGALDGLDDEGEVMSSYRPAGHPALWFAIGDFYRARFMSKALGILIQASELGLLDSCQAAL